MGARGIAFWLTTTLVASPAAAETEFPYQATVTVDGASIHSGPGEAYYRTATIAAGANVEIYRHAPGGWCAIRPPAGSFSWVSARYVRTTDEPGVGQVTEPGVPARIGSKFGRQRHVVQVRLDSGEPVEILGEQNNGGQTWYRIAPPAGEFRWIEESLLSTNDKLNSDEAPLEPPPVRTDAPVPSNDPATESMPPPDAEGTLAPSWESQPPAEDEPAAKPPTGGFRARLPNSAQFAPPPLHANDAVPPKDSADAPQPRRWRQAGSPAWRQPAGGASARFSAAPVSTPQSHAAPPFVPGGASPGTPSTQRLIGPEPSSDAFIEKRRAIAFALSHIVSQEPRAWRFDSLRRRATALLAAAPTVAERTEVRQLLAKIARFEELQHRRAALNGKARTVIAQRAGNRPPIPNVRRQPAKPGYAPPFVGQSNEPRVPRERTDRNPVPPAARSRPASRPGDTIRIPDDAKPRLQDDERFDAVGFLKRVGSRRRDAPRYALVDATGDVVSFITPSPGLNLQPYIGDEIGVFGTRGIMPEYRRAHVTAARVAPILR